LADEYGKAHPVPQAQATQLGLSCALRLHLTRDATSRPLRLGEVVVCATLQPGRLKSALSRRGSIARRACVTEARGFLPLGRRVREGPPSPAGPGDPTEPLVRAQVGPHPGRNVPTSPTRRGGGLRYAPTGETEERPLSARVYSPKGLRNRSKGFLTPWQMRTEKVHAARRLRRPN
jgi:hypothetical protein